MPTGKLNALQELRAWVLSTDQSLSMNTNRYFTKMEIVQTKALITACADQFHKTHPFYETELRTIADRLFSACTYWGYPLNHCLFGQLYLIVKHAAAQQQNEFWSNIHPRIVNVAQALYADGYFDSAAEKALREVETYMRELYARYKPGKGDPSEINSIKEALLADADLYLFDRTTQNGKNFYNGIKKLFEDAFTAYRNPASHRNTDISKREAFERITLASQLTYVLDDYRKPAQ